MRPIFPEPEALLTSAPRLPGTDGRKMSKSYGNAIFLTDSPDVVSKKLATMMTDPARKRRSDPGDPDVCPVFDLHKIFSAPEDDRPRQPRVPHGGDRLRGVQEDCRRASECNFSRPFRNAEDLTSRIPQKVWDVLEDGTRKARAVAQATMAEVRAAVKLT